MLSKIITKSSRMSNARLFFYYLWPIPQKIGGEGDCHYIITKINISSCLISDEKATTYVHIPVLENLCGC